MRRTDRAILVLGTLLASPLSADEIDDRIAELTNDDPLRRAAARDALRAHGYPIVPRLAAAAARSTDRRGHEMLYEMELVPEDDDGGLGAAMFVDRERASSGERFLVTVVLHNSSPVAIGFRGDALSGLRIRVGAAEGREEIGFETISCNLGFPRHAAMAMGIEPRATRCRSSSRSR